VTGTTGINYTSLAWGIVNRSYAQYRLKKIPGNYKNFEQAFLYETFTAPYFEILILVKEIVVFICVEEDL